MSVKCNLIHIVLAIIVIIALLRQLSFDSFKQYVEINAGDVKENTTHISVHVNHRKIKRCSRLFTLYAGLIKERLIKKIVWNLSNATGRIVNVAETKIESPNIPSSVL